MILQYVQSFTRKKIHELIRMTFNLVFLSPNRAKRDFDTKKAGYDVEVNTAKAEAELAYELQV